MNLRGSTQRELVRGAATVAANYALRGSYRKARGALAVHRNPKPGWSAKYASKIKAKVPKGRRGTMCTNTAKFDNDIGSLRTFTVASNIVKGTNYGERIGNRIFLRGINLQYQLTNKSTSIADNYWVRFFLVIDKFHLSSITQDTFMPHNDTYAPTNYVGTGNTLQLVDRLNPQRFTVLWDKLYSLNINRNEGNNGHDCTLIDQYVPINKWVTYNDNAANEEKLNPLIKLCYFMEGDNDAPPKGTGLEIISIDSRQYVDFINP